MKLEDFRYIRHFSADEVPGWQNVEPDLLIRLDEMRHEDGGEMGWVFIIHSAWRPEGSGYHPRGMAVDGHMADRETREPLPLLRQWAIAERWGWGGIGLYPFWTFPGLHLDTRPYSFFDRHARWYRNEQGFYRPHYEYLEAQGLWTPAQGG